MWEVWVKRTKRKSVFYKSFDQKSIFPGTCEDFKKDNRKIIGFFPSIEFLNMSEVCEVNLLLSRTYKDIQL